MAAFGLEEAGHYGEALDAGLAAVDANPDDVWAIHAVVHTYEMQGRVDEGIGFLRSDGTQWEAGNLFTVHNWWHLALYELEAGRPERSLAIYDAEIHHERVARRADRDARRQRPAVAPAASTASTPAAASARSPTRGRRRRPPTPWYVFNDLHATMALRRRRPAGARPTS